MRRPTDPLGSYEEIFGVGWHAAGRQGGKRKAQPRSAHAAQRVWLAYSWMQGQATQDAAGLGQLDL
jgi:hypothetical protein